MTAPTTQSNLNKITELEGTMKTLQATMEGKLALQATHVKQINENSQAVKHSVDRLTQHCTTLFTKADEQSRDTAAIKMKVKGHEDLCDERDKRIESTIAQGFANLSNVKAAEDKAEDKADSGKTGRYSMYLALIIAIAGWIISSL